MKWFKHFVTASGSVKLNNLIDELGVEGYGRYWLLLELLAEEYDGSSTVFEVHFRKISAKVQIKFQKKLETFLQKLADFSLITLESSGKVYKIGCPILLELQDKDSKYNRKRIVKKSLVTTLEEEEDKNKKKNKNKSEVVSISESLTHPVKPKVNFSEISNLWSSYFPENPAPFSLATSQAQAFLETSHHFSSKDQWRELFEKARSLEWYTKQGWFNFLWIIKHENALKIQQSRNTTQDKGQAQKINMGLISQAIATGKTRIADLPESLGLTELEKDFIRDNGGLIQLGKMDNFQLNRLAKECAA